MDYLEDYLDSARSESFVDSESEAGEIVDAREENRKYTEALRQSAEAVDREEEEALRIEQDVLMLEQQLQEVEESRQQIKQELEELDADAGTEPDLDEALELSEARKRKEERAQRVEQALAAAAARKEMGDVQPVHGKSTRFCSTGPDGQRQCTPGCVVM